MLITTCIAQSRNANTSEVDSNCYQKQSKKQSQGGFWSIPHPKFGSTTHSKADITQLNDTWYLEMQNKWGSLEIYTLDARTYTSQLHKYFESWL